MAKANQFRQPMDYYGNYKSNTWAGYYFKEALGYTSGVHTGVDYNGPGAGNADLGLGIYAIANGVVRWVGNRSDIGFGNTTIIEHQLSPTLAKELGCDSLFSRIMHQNEIKVHVGQEVSMGDVVGTVGNSGTTFAHLHLDLYKSTIDGGGVHFRYDKNTQLQSYLDSFEFIQAHLTAVDVEASLLGYQRLVSNADGVNGRIEPNTGGAILKEFKHGEVLDFKGYVVGQDPYGNGNNIWFVGRYSNTYWYSGAFADTGTHDLPDLTLAPVTPPPTTENPAPEKRYEFEKDFDFINDVFPAAIGNFEYGNFPTTPTAIVIHDYGTAGVDTYNSLKAEFTRKGSEKSIHFAVSKDKMGQNVKLGDRAYHAGPQGNVYVGIEVDPAYKDNPEQITNVRRIVKAVNQFYGYSLTAPMKNIKHSSIMQTECGDDIDLAKYDVTEPVVVPPKEDDTEFKGLLKKLVQLVIDFFESINGKIKK